MTWPGGRAFAFTIFDDPDAQTIEVTQAVYSFLADLGLRTTIAVWPLAPGRESNSGGETCANPRYLDLLLKLQSEGFEIAYHNTAPAAHDRDEIVQGLDRFAQYFGAPPVSMANHYNPEAIYWGSARLSGWRRTAYNLATRNANNGKFFGHIPGHPMFWGDLCRDRIRYCRNFVFSDINTLRQCPFMPYADPLRPFVREWFASSEGHDAPAFLSTIADANQDRLEEQGGASIVYTHFGHGYLQDGRLIPEFRRLIERLVRKNGWFVPVATLLDHLKLQHGPVVLDDRRRQSLEAHWLWEKLFRGTS